MPALRSFHTWVETNLHPPASGFHRPWKTVTVSIRLRVDWSCRSPPVFMDSSGDQLWWIHDSWGADWTRLLLLLQCDVSVLKSRTLPLLLIVDRMYPHKLFLNIAPSANHRKKYSPLPAIKSHAESATLQLEQLHPNICICCIFLEGKMGFKIFDFLVAVNAGVLAGEIDCCLSCPVSLDF